MPESWVKPLLAGLCLLGAASIGQQVLVPSLADRLLPFEPAALARPPQGPWRPLEPLPTTAFQRHWSRGATIRYEHRAAEGAASGGEPALLLLTAVKTSKPGGFEIAKALQDAPQLLLNERRIINTDAGQIAIGRIEGRQALQTCLFPTGQLYVGHDPVRRGNGDRLAVVRDGLERELGLSNNRHFGCTLHTLVLPNGMLNLPVNQKITPGHPAVQALQAILAGEPVATPIGAKGPDPEVTSPPLGLDKKPEDS